MTDTNGPSLLDRLKARYDALAAQAEQTLKVPVGHGVDDLLVEYREPDWLETQEITKKWASSSDPYARRNAAAEQLAHCCVNIWTRDDNGQEIAGVDGRWVPALGTGEAAITFARAAALLGLPAEDGIQAVCGVLRSDWEVLDHSTLLGLFEPGKAPEVADQVVGESMGAIS